MNDATAEMQVTRRIAHGDTRAFAALMRRHSRMLFRAAVVRIAANEALARRRKAMRGPEMLSLGGEDPDAERQLRAVQEVSVEETAEALGLPPATVKTRLFRARRRLRQTMAAA